MEKKGECVGVTEFELVLELERKVFKLECIGKKTNENGKGGTMYYAK